MRNLKSRDGVETQIKNNKLVQRKQLRIASGASRLFFKKGYFRTSVREISKATGLTIGNLYDYIRRKEDVLYLVFDVFHSMWVDSLQKEGVLEIEDPVKQLRAAIQKTLEFVNKNEDLVLLLYTESKALPKSLLKSILEKESGFVKCFERNLANGAKKGIFRIKDPFLLANIIVYLLLIWPLRGWNLKKSYTKEKINEHITQFIMNSVLK
jgi:AcrR family transcriptional regulator